MPSPIFAPFTFSSNNAVLNAAFHPPQVSFDPSDRALAHARPLAAGGAVSSQTSRASVPGLGSGQMTTDTADFSGLAISRQVFRADDGRVAVRGVVENRASSGVRLGEWPVLVAGADGLRLDNAPAGQWKMFRNGRHKNDHPVVVTLGRVDANYLDAAGAGSETGDQAAVNAPLTLVSDPMTTLRAGRASLLAGFLSQLEHLSFIAVTMTPDRQRLDSLAAVAEFDGCLLPPGVRRETGWLVLDAGADPFAAIGRYTQSVADHHSIAPLPQPKNVYCTWYFYANDDLSAQTLEDDLSWFEKRRWPINTFQIDDGWQDCWGDWRSKPEWGSQDIAAVARRIRSLGYEPGVWTCPFIASLESQLTRQRPEWILKDDRGEPVIFLMGGRQYYTLDPTHPGMLAWLKDLFAGLRRDGYTYHKFDFMRAVAQASKSALNRELGAGSGPQGANPLFHDPTATRAQAFRRGLAAIHDALGHDAYLLVCGGLYLPAIGLADAQRSGSDVRSRWTEPRADTRIRQNLLRWWMNRLWRQDPDAMMVRRREKPFRENTISLGLFTDEEARTLTVNQYLGGGLVCFTERMSELDTDRAALYTLCIPSLGLESVPADLFGPGRIPAVHTTPVPSPAPGLPSWLTVAVINWLDAPQTFRLNLDKDSLGVAPPPAPRYLVWEFFEQRFLGVFEPGQPLPPLDVPPHASRVLRVTPWDGASIALAGANRHLSMGGVEIARWTPTPRGVEVDVASPWPSPFSLWFALPGQPQPRIVEQRAAHGQRLTLHA